MLCRCASCKLGHAATRTDVDMVVKVVKSNARTHQCGTCARIFGTKQLLAKHRKEDHKATHICSICDGQYQHVQSLNQHIREVHFIGEENQMSPSVCCVCNKGAKDIVRHGRQRHVTLVECSGCKLNFTRYDLAQHEKTYVKFNYADCGIYFMSRHSLRNHRARWCNQRQ